MEIVKGETWRDEREEILGEERATLVASRLPEVKSTPSVPKQV
jgi:hypothetical protein